ncbi:50S ribosomal protein L10 [Candidatus Saccharibacteria bacterium]|nr:50S ribosomal protein L10 [Candidatus Saccharibacteria bacterium]
MALSREKKEQMVAQLQALLADSKLTVIAKYQGTPVKSMQQLRSSAAVQGSLLKVAKNRLFKIALASDGRFKNVDTSQFQGQLLYGFNNHDEVAPARSLSEFTKTNPHIEFVAGLNPDGTVLSADELKSLANLPSKEVLRAQLISTISAPVSGFVNVLAGNIRSLMNVLNARSEVIS